MLEREQARNKIGTNEKLTQETNVIWKQEDIEKMIELKQQGYGNAAIGSILNRSTNSIAQKLTKLRFLSK